MNQKQEMDRETLLEELAGMDQKILDLAKSVTKYQLVAEAWRDLWAQFAAMVEAFDGLIYICSENYEIEFMNQRFIERTGCYPLGQKCYQALHDRQDVCPWCVNERVFQGETVRWEICSPKDERWYYVVNTPIVHPDGTMSKMAMIQDITERKELESARRLSERKYRSIFENAVEGIFQSSPEGRFLDINPAMARMFGYESPAEMLAGIADIRHQLYVSPDRRDRFMQLMGQEGEVQGFQAEMFRRDGGKILVAINAHAVLDENNRLVYYKGFIQDITPRQADSGKA